MKKKIVVVSHSNYAQGGAELCFVEMIKVLYESGKYDLYAVFPKQTGDLHDKCSGYLNESFYLTLPWWTKDVIDKSFFYHIRKKVRGLLSSTIKSTKLLAKLKPDYVLTNTSVIPQFFFASSLLNIKHVWFVHELPNRKFISYFLGDKFTLKFIANSPNVLLNSKFMLSMYSQFSKKQNLHFIYQPTEINSSTPRVEKKDNKSQTINMLIVGAVTEFKGQIQAIRACEKLFLMNIDFKLVILGSDSGEYAEKLKKSIKSEIKDKISFVPFTNTPELYYRETDILLGCSLCESLGRVPIEAMKMGVPVVLADHCGYKELVVNGFNGYSYVYNNIDSMIESIIITYKNRFELGVNAQEWGEANFNKLKFSTELIQLLEYKLN